MSEETRSSLLKKIKPMPERAQELREIFRQGFEEPIVPRIWPKLQFLTGVGSGGFKVYADKIKEKYMGERMMDTIVEIYNHMNDSDKDAFTLGDAEDMVEDQIRMDKEAGREPLTYDPQFIYDTVVELMEQDAE